MWYPSGATPGPGPEPGDSNFAWPFPLSQVTEEHEDNGGYLGHQGIDFGIGPSNTEGSPIPASAVGEVVVNDWDNGWGWHVKLSHGTHQGEPIWTLYAHMHAQSPLSVGATVVQGQSVGGIGTTGDSTGNHLHFETYLGGSVYGVNTVDPRYFMSIYNPDNVVV